MPSHPLSPGDREALEEAIDLLKRANKCMSFPWNCHASLTAVALGAIIRDGWADAPEPSDAEATEKGAE